MKFLLKSILIVLFIIPVNVFALSSSWNSMRWDVDLWYLDSDGDGMPDNWENHYGLDPLDDRDASDDPDYDGFSNLQEYRGNSDPKNPDSHPSDPKNPDSHPSMAMPWIPLLLLDE